MHNKDEWDFDFDADVDATRDDENGGALGETPRRRRTRPRKGPGHVEFLRQARDAKATRASPGMKSDDKLRRVASEY